MRWWLQYSVYGLGVLPVPDPRRLRSGDWEYQVAIEDRLETFAVWLANCRPSGRQISRKSIGKYISSTRA